MLSCFKRIRVLTYSVLCCAYPLVGHAQHVDDHLEPSRGGLFEDRRYQPFHTAIQQVLFAGLSDKPLARIVVVPAFAPEYLVSVEQNAGTYTVISRVCQQQVRAALREHPARRVTAQTRMATLPEPLATAVVAVIRQALSQTQYPAPAPRYQLDGTTYYFMAFQRWAGWWNGQTWSPDSDTRMRALVELVAHLKELTADPSNQQRQVDLNQEATQLMARLMSK
ncbi:hypothetical protein [Hymenobacter negativus]|uniref:DUF4136 domain-containing protein n=1 Tax=Hymenobacter negativus TaxID=2795026 RepID=A0ABS3Q9I1_9BACT|nr:hypothetical protein [Hymenobacter negativus]MBO2007903.1 hypothetical protein [Hymenobacter negativus]